MYVFMRMNMARHGSVLSVQGGILTLLSLKKQQHITLNMHLHVCATVFFLFSVLCQMNNFLCLPSRTAAEAMVMNPPEPTKEKEKQGFFRAIKKKKKKTQIVRLLQQAGTFL